MIEQSNPLAKRPAPRPFLARMLGPSLMIVTLGMALTAAVIFLTTERTESVSPLGRQAPDFALCDQTGRVHHLADYKGRPVVLAFFPERSPAIEEEMRSLQRKIATFDRVGAKIFGISATTEAAQKAFHDSEKLQFPLLADPGGKVAQQYGVLGADQRIQNVSVVMDATGVVMLTMPTAQIDHREHGRQLLEAAQCCFVPMPTSRTGNIGKTLADFSLPDAVTGKPETLFGDRKQKATVLLFTSTKCPCSQGYDERVKRLATEYAAKNVRFLAVNSSADESAVEVAAHTQQVGLPFPALKDANNAIADRLDARVTPEAFVLDAKGVLRYHGRIDDNRDATQVKTQDVRQALDALLADTKPPHVEASALGCAILRARR